MPTPTPGPTPSQITPDGISANPGASSELVDITGTAGRIGSPAGGLADFRQLRVAGRPRRGSPRSAWNAGARAAAAAAPMPPRVPPAAGAAAGSTRRSRSRSPRGAATRYTVGGAGHRGERVRDGDDHRARSCPTTIWTPPAGVTSIQVQCWGGGGAGAARDCPTAPAAEAAAAGSTRRTSGGGHPGDGPTPSAVGGAPGRTPSSPGTR